MTKERKLTGWHVLFGFVAAFGVIITVNLVMAYNAVSSFPGLEVKNGYIASQSFDKRRLAQEALGWRAYVELRDGLMQVTLTDRNGKSVQVGKLQALVGRPTSDRDDFTPELSYNGRAYVGPVRLAQGKWIVHLTAVSLEGAPFAQRLDVHVNS